MPKKLELSHTLESTRGSVRIPNPVPDELVRYWDEVMSKVNPSFAARRRNWICRRQRLGTDAIPPVTEGDERLLIWATSIHPGIFFYNEDGDISGAHLCPCIPCAQRIRRILHGGGRQPHRRSREAISVTRERMTTQSRWWSVGWASMKIVQQLQTAISGRATWRCGSLSKSPNKSEQEVSRQLAAFFAAEARNTTNTIRKQMLIAESFRQQSDMQRGEPEVQRSTGNRQK